MAVTPHSNKHVAFHTASPGGYILPFSALDRRSLPIAGGKAANLGEMTRAGLPVPPGFCITTPAYTAVVGVALDTILDALATATPDDASRLEALAAEARESILHAPVPEDVSQAIVHAYEALSATGGTGTAQPGTPLPVAVRSSATAEDLPTASFAGQQDTYLNVVGADAVLDAVRRCWASLWTGRAVAYRAANHIDQRAVQLAVVVQQMVPSAVAGVMFTANPLTGRRRQAVIDAAPGLGEAVVSGAVTPDHFVVNSLTGEVVERRLGDKRLKIVALPGGGTERVEVSDHAAEPAAVVRGQGSQPAGVPASATGLSERDGPGFPVAPSVRATGRAGTVPRLDEPGGRTPPPATSQSSLSDDQLRALARLGARVEAHYGAPQDTEWAIGEDGQLWLTQSRPITTLFPLPDNAPSDDANLRVYFNANVAQGVLHPLTPMGLQAFRLIGSSFATLCGFPPRNVADGPPVIAVAAQSLFLDITALIRSPIGRRVAGFALGHMEARSHQLLDVLFADPRLSPRPAHPLRAIIPLARIAARTGAPRRLANGLRQPAVARADFRRAAEQALALGDLRESATAAQRLHAAERLMFEGPPHILPAALSVLPVAFGALGVAGRLLGDLATPEELETVRRALPHNPTTEMDLQLWDLATQVRADAAAADAVRRQPTQELAADYQRGTLTPVLQQGLAAFLRAYGHRGVAEIDLGLPRWSEDPAHILGVLANYLQVDDPTQRPDVQFRRAAAQADAMVEELARRARRKSPLHGVVVRLCLRRVRQLAGLREAPKFYIVAVFAKARDLLKQAGAELAVAGCLETAEDVFFVSLPEARAALAGADLRPVVRERRREYERELRRRHQPRLLLSDGTEPAPAAAAPTGDGVLRGTPASGGTVTATARVILDPQGAHLEPGEVLVAPSTDPGWTPLFLTAGGLVMEMGGPMSHGAVVAREYGIPAVVGVPGATERLTTGQRIAVDGSAGTITPA